ncbi:MAG TPA: hypothetical protein VJI15_05845 [Candidatus Nanoarchaeia archaeon]|nr:hypothetical protein [Candidatus Nanoarchaeia archaeon]
MNPKDMYQELSQDQLFKDWQKQNKNSYLSHFFVQMTAAMDELSSWQVGFFDKDSQKITIFEQGNKGFIIQPAADVFKKDEDVVEALSMKQVKISLEEAKTKGKEELAQVFPNEQMGDGFLILQVFNHQPVWNFTFITKTIKFANVKISASSGKAVDTQTVDLVQK